MFMCDYNSSIVSSEVYLSNLSVRSPLLLPVYAISFTMYLSICLFIYNYEQVGPIHVLRLLLFAAFAVSSGDRKSPQSKESSAKFDLSPACEAFFRLCSYTASKKCRRLPESEECVTIRSVLFDIYHSVSSMLVTTIDYRMNLSAVQWNE